MKKWNRHRLDKLKGPQPRPDSGAFFLRMPYQPARELIMQVLRIALASDQSRIIAIGNMNFVVHLLYTNGKTMPEEAINAATYNGACAMETKK